MSESKGVQLIMVMMRSKDSQVYGRVKVMGDCIFNIPTQVLLDRSVSRCNPSLAHNICLKLNSKLGGTNQRLAEIPEILKKPVRGYLFTPKVPRNYSKVFLNITQGNVDGR